MEVATTDRTSDDLFFEDLERVAKGLSVVTDRASTDELRRLVGELQDDERAAGIERGRFQSLETDGRDDGPA